MFFLGTDGKKADILHLLTKVSAKVTEKSVKRTTREERSKRVTEEKIVKQTPCFMSSLRQQLYLPTASDISDVPTASDNSSAAKVIPPSCM